MTRIGIIGTGWGARVQVPLFRAAGLDVRWIAGRDPEKTRARAQELDVEPVSDWREAIAADGVDLVSVTTPPAEHVEMAVAVLRAGKHLLTEKPTALSAGEARRLVDAGRAHREQIAIVDHELRFLPSFLHARSHIDEIGSLRYAELRYCSSARGDRERPWNWWSDEQQGGGIWGAVGSHLVDALRYLGFEPQAVRAQLTTVIGQRPFEGGTRRVTSDDLASVQLRFTGGTSAYLTLSAVAAFDEPLAITLYGERGAFRLVGEELLFASNGSRFMRIAGSELAQLPGNSAGGAFGSGTAQLGRALRAALADGDRSALEPAATLEDGLAHQIVLDAARTSSRNRGEWVEMES